MDLEEKARVASEEAQAERLRLQQMERRAEEAEHAVVAAREEMVTRGTRIEALEREVQEGQDEARREREALVLRIQNMEAEVKTLQEALLSANAEVSGEAGRRETLSVALSETEARLSEANKAVEELRGEMAGFNERAEKVVQEAKAESTEAFILGFYRCRKKFEEQVPSVDISFLDVVNVSAEMLGTAVEDEDEEEEDDPDESEVVGEVPGIEASAPSGVAGSPKPSASRPAEVPANRPASSAPSAPQPSSGTPAPPS